MANFIFDFDGTLADTSPLISQLMIDHSENLGGKPLVLADLAPLRDMHAREVLNFLGVPLWRVPFFVQKFRTLVSQHVNELNVFPEWQQILPKLKQEQHLVGLLSSNTFKTVEQVLKRHHLFDLFDFIQCGKSLFGKQHALKKLIHKNKLALDNTYYIGDEVRDIEAAHAAQIQAIALSWGFNSHARLKQASPDKLAANFQQLHQIFTEINGSSAV